MISFEIHYQNPHTPDTAINILAKKSDLSITQLKSAISKGALWLEKASKNHKSVQRLRRFKKLINTGDTLHFYYNEAVLLQQPAEAILIEDQRAYSVWYKPNGMLSQGSKWSDHCTITRWAQTHLPDDRACFLVHRLDRATSGLIIIAHTKKAAQLFSQLFEQHQLTKCYQAIVSTDDQPKEKIIVEEPIDGKSAKSNFSLLSYCSTSHLAHYQICIDTGRKHQIRKHCQHLKMPIVGDRLYGNEQQPRHDLQLCAVKLGFTCPITSESRQYQLPAHLTLNFTEICG